MILNHKAAIELLVESAEDIGVNRYTLTNLHALLADNLLEDPRTPVGCAKTPVASVPRLIPDSNSSVARRKFARLLELGAAIRDPFEQSFFLLVHIPYLQPFVDITSEPRDSLEHPIDQAQPSATVVHRRSGADLYRWD